MANPQSRKKTVLITGCTPGGIGFAVATEFQARGLHVIATVRNAALLEELRSKGMSAVQLDVTNEASIAACKSQVEEITNGKLDILVKNAGGGLTIPCTDIPLATARSVYETKLFSIMTLVSTFTPLLLRTRGLIINITSICALVLYVFGSVKASSKAAMVSYSRTLSLGLRPFGVGVMVAMAGTVRSNMGKKKRGSLPRGGLYARVQGLYVARLGFSQKREARPMETGVLARGLVGEALKGEGGGWWWGRWVRGRRRDWWYCGGQSGLVYWGPVIGRVGDGLGGVEEVWAWGAGEDGG